jgi:hypothetical protein
MSTVDQVIDGKFRLGQFTASSDARSRSHSSPCRPLAVSPDGVSPSQPRTTMMTTRGPPLLPLAMGIQTEPQRHRQRYTQARRSRAGVRLRMTRGI